MYLNIWNLRDTILNPDYPIDDVVEEIVVLSPDTFEEPPYILTLTASLTYTDLLHAERVLVTGRDPMDPCRLYVERGYDNSVAQAWPQTPGDTVYVYNLFTAAYYDILRDQVSYLDGKPVVLEMSNVDLDLASLLVHSISVSDGSVAGMPQGWNVDYHRDPSTSEVNLVEVRTTSMLDQYSGRLRMFATNNIRIEAATDVNILAGTGVDPASGNINLYTIDSYGINLNVVNGSTGLTVSPNQVIVRSPSSFIERPSFEDGIVIEPGEVLEPLVGTIKYIDAPDPGFYGYYSGDWNKLGFTAEIIIGQETFIYCFVDGDHYISDDTILVKNLVGTVDHGDTALIKGVPYEVLGYDVGTKILTLSFGLTEDVPNNTPILITKQLTDAMDGYTLRFSNTQRKWVATNQLQIPSDMAEPIFTYGRELYLQKVSGVGGSLVADAAITIGQGGPHVGSPGTIQFKNNNYYGTVLTQTESGWTTVEIALIPDVAYEFLSEINIPDIPESDGHIIRYDYAASQWIHTADIRITSSGISVNKPITFNEAVTFNSTVALDLGYSFSGRVAFLGGVKFGQNILDTSQIGNMDLVAGYRYSNPYADPPAGERHAVLKFVASKSDVPIVRVLNPIPYVEDFPLAPGASAKFIIPITAENVAGSVRQPYWTLNKLDVADVGSDPTNPRLRFPARMKREALGGDADHVHPVDELNLDGFPWVHEFQGITLPEYDSDFDMTQGEFDLRMPVFGETTQFQLRFKRGAEPAVDTNCIYIQPVISAGDPPRTIDLNTYIHGNLHVMRMFNSDPARAGQLTVESTIKVGMNTSAGEPGMIRYMPHDPNNPGGPGDLQGYVVAVVDPETNATISGWLSLTSGLPQPLDQDWGGMLYYSGDIQQYMSCTTDGAVGKGTYILNVHIGLDWPPKSGDVIAFEGFSYTIINATTSQLDPLLGTIQISPKLRADLIDGTVGAIFARPEWSYTDQVKFRNGVFIVDAPMTLHSDLILEDVYTDYLDSGPIKVGDAAWLDDFPNQVKVGTLRFTDSLWLYADGMWKDLLSNNAITLPNIPIEPTEDGVILRYDLLNEVWEATGIIKVPTTNDLVDISTNVQIAGSVDIAASVAIHSSLDCTGFAWFHDQIQVGVPIYDNLEGRIRFNGDFEGYIPNIGWVSFTRRFDESPVAQATAAGKFLVSASAGSYYNWAQSTKISFEEGDVLSIVGGLAVETAATFGDTLTATGTIKTLGSLSVVSSATVVGSYPVLITADALIGEFEVAVAITQRPPIDGLFAVVIGGTSYIINHYDSNLSTFTLATALTTNVNAGTNCYYGFSDTVIQSAAGMFGVNFAIANVSFAQYAYMDTLYSNSFNIGKHNYTPPTPGSLKFEDNRFHGYLESGTWQEFGPIDIREYFDFPETNDSRRNGDVLAYNGLGRWIETPLLNLESRWAEFQMPNLAIRSWQIRTSSPVMDNDLMSRSFKIVYTEPYENLPITMLELDYHESTLVSDLRLEGNLDVLGNTRLRGTLSLIGTEEDPAFIFDGNGQVTGDILGIRLLSAYNARFEAAIVSEGPDAQILIGDVDERPRYVIDGFHSWIRRSLYLDGDLCVTGDIYNAINIDLEGRITLGDGIAWLAPKSAEIPITVARSIVLEADGNLFACKSGYFGHYIVPGKTDEPDYYAPKGAIRYTAEGPEDRGDWEGWDGLNWRSMTSLGGGGGSLNILNGFAYQANYWDYALGKWRGTDALHLDDSHVWINDKLHIGADSDLSGYHSVLNIFNADDGSLIQAYGLGTISSQNEALSMWGGHMLSTYAYMTYAYQRVSEHSAETITLNGEHTTVGRLDDQTVNVTQVLMSSVDAGSDTIQITRQQWTTYVELVVGSTIFTIGSPTGTKYTVIASLGDGYYQLDQVLPQAYDRGTVLYQYVSFDLQDSCLIGDTTVDLYNLQGQWIIADLLQSIVFEGTAEYYYVNAVTSLGGGVYRATLGKALTANHSADETVRVYPRNSSITTLVGDAITILGNQTTTHRGNLKLTRSLNGERHHMLAPLNIVPDDAPLLAISNGDIWATSTDLRTRIGGVEYSLITITTQYWQRALVSGNYWLSPTTVGDRVTIDSGYLDVGTDGSIAGTIKIHGTSTYDYWTLLNSGAASVNNLTVNSESFGTVATFSSGQYRFGLTGGSLASGHLTVLSSGNITTASGTATIGNFGAVSATSTARGILLSTIFSSAGMAVGLEFGNINGYNETTGLVLASTESNHATAKSISITSTLGLTGAIAAALGSVTSAAGWATGIQIGAITSLDQAIGLDMSGTITAATGSTGYGVKIGNVWSNNTTQGYALYAAGGHIETATGKVTAARGFEVPVRAPAPLVAEDCFGLKIGSITQTQPGQVYGIDIGGLTGTVGIGPLWGIRIAGITGYYNGGGDKDVYGLKVGAVFCQYGTAYAIHTDLSGVCHFGGATEQVGALTLQSVLNLNAVTITALAVNDHILVGNFASDQNGVASLTIGTTTATAGNSHAYGLQIGNVTASGSGIAYGVKTGLGYNYFGDDLTALGVVRAGKRFVADAYSQAARNFGLNIEAHYTTTNTFCGGIDINAMTNNTAGSGSLIGVNIGVLSSASSVGDPYGLVIWGVTATNANRDACGIQISDVTSGASGTAYALRTNKGLVLFNGETTAKLYKMQLGAMTFTTTSGTTLLVGGATGSGTDIGVTSVRIGATTSTGIGFAYGLSIEAVTASATGTTFGLFVNDCTGGISNYAIYTGLGLVQFGDRLNLTAAPTTITTRLSIAAQTYTTNASKSISIGNITGSGTNIGVSGIVIGSVTGTGTSSNYGLDIGACTGGDNNYAIRTAAGQISFGGETTVAASKLVVGAMVFSTTGSSAIKITGTTGSTADIGVRGLTIGSTSGSGAASVYGITIDGVVSGATGATYGLNIGSCTGGANNYAIKTSSGQINFGGETTAATSKVAIGSLTFTTNQSAAVTIGNVTGSGTTVGVIGLNIGTVTGTANSTNYGIKIGNVTGGTNNYSIYTDSGLAYFGGIVNTTESYQVDGVQVVTNRQAAITNAVIAHNFDNSWPTAEAQVESAANALGTKINQILQMLRTHGLITP